MKAVLFFDTSRIAAGCLMSCHNPLPTLHALRRVRYGTADGDEALEALFTAAKALQAEGYLVEVGAEQPQGQDTKFAQGRAIANENIGILKQWARRYGLRWGGVYAPATAKVSLARHGRAEKREMISWANRLFGARIAELTGGPLVYTGTAATCHEHEADCIGGAMAACAGKPYIVRQTGRRCHKPKPEKLFAPHKGAKPRQGWGGLFEQGSKGS